MHFILFESDHTRPLKRFISDTYVKSDGNIFEQVVGISMGVNASPFIANLFLSYCYMTDNNFAKSYHKTPDIKMEFT